MDNLNHGVKPTIYIKAKHSILRAGPHWTDHRVTICGIELFQCMALAAPGIQKVIKSAFDNEYLSGYIEKRR